VTGTIERDGYRIEKVVYQSLPGALVAAHLYVPARLRRPAPAILFYVGHWSADSKARPDFQAFCINMARLGFVVLNFDPFGQGERGMSSRDHRRTEGLLVGVSQQGFAEYETQCALAYLLSRKEVDPKRIGMTGASGGGYNTWMTAALDDRIAVAVPVVGTSEFHEQMAARRPLNWDPNDHCHYVPGLMTYANNHELLTMVAPRPVLIVAASEDRSFPIGGVREVSKYGRQLYQSYRVPEKLGFYEDPSAGHGYQQKKREAAYGWFLRWLMWQGDGGPRPEPPTETSRPDSAELRCFPVGENQPAGPGMVGVVRRLARDLPPAKPRLRSRNLEEVLGWLPAQPIFEARLEPRPVQRIVVASEPGLNVPTFLVRPSGTERGVVLAIDDRGKEALASDDAIKSAVLNGWAVCGVDARGIGELATSKASWTFAASALLGENFVWRQSWDLLQSARYLASSGAFKRFGIYARGHNASLAATYAIGRLAESQQPPLQWFVLQDGFVSFRQFLDRPQSLEISYRLGVDEGGRRKPLDREIPPSYFVFNVLRFFDLRQLLSSTRARGLILNPVDGDWNQMSAGAARKLLPARIHLLCGVTTADAMAEFRELLR
jgi:dienelactone hydrolase